MHQRKPELYMTDLEAKRPSLSYRLCAFFGTAYGTTLGILLFLVLFAAAGTSDYNAAVAERQATQHHQR
jgi:hypothetical protein